MTMRSTPNFARFVAHDLRKSCKRQSAKVVGASSPRSVAISLSFSRASWSKAAFVLPQPLIGVAPPVALAPRPVEKTNSLSFERSSMIDNAKSLSGTSCARSPFVLSRGIAHRRCVRSISLQVAPPTSERR